MVTAVTAQRNSQHKLQEVACVLPPQLPSPPLQGTLGIYNDKEGRGEKRGGQETRRHESRGKGRIREKERNLD